MKPFFFDGNQAFGMVESRADWDDIMAQYAEHVPDRDLGDAKCVPRNPAFPEDAPNFGFYREHTGPETLREFFAAHGCDWPTRMVRGR